MPDSDPTTLVSTEWLAARLSDPQVKILDASWYLPNMNRSGRDEYLQQHIVGANFFDIDEISDTDSDLPHMVPPIEKFVSRMRAMGIGNRDQVVVYDGAGLFSAARVWWLFRLMGKKGVAVLDGGLPKWLAEGRPVDAVTAPAGSSHLTARFNANIVRDATQVAEASKSAKTQIIDARAGGRFRGEEPEPRTGLASGHIPGSRNVFFKDLLTPEGTMKPLPELRAVFADAGVDLGGPAITSCGSGVTAAVLNLALERLGHTDHALYDGSWSEWGTFDETMIATGDA